MSVRDNFTQEEWLKVMLGPGRAGSAVVAASVSGLTGVVAEMQAIGGAIRESVSAVPRTPLMEAMAAELLGTPPDAASLQATDQAKNMDDVRQQSVEAVRQAVWLVSSKTSPEDAAAYKQMLMKVAERAAAAAKEGGFLGIGGEQVNDKEKAVLQELRGVIGLEAEAPATNPPATNPSATDSSATDTTPTTPPLSQN